MIDLIQLVSTIFGALLSYITYLIFSAYQDAKYYESKGITYLGNSTYQSFYRSIAGTTLMEEYLEKYTQLKRKKKKFAVGKEFKSTNFILVDLDLIKQVLIKDFDHFVDRRNSTFTKNDPLLYKMLISVTGNEWKDLRSNINPAFTTGKIRRMFKVFDKSAKQLINFYQNETKGLTTEINLHDGYSKYTMDIVASIAFGLDSDGTIFNQKSPSLFEQMAHKLFQFDLSTLLKTAILKFTPRLGDYFKLSIIPKDVQEFFSAIVKKSLKGQEESKERKDDFIQLMIDVSEGKLKSDDGDLGDFEKSAVIRGLGPIGHSKHRDFSFSDDEIVSQCALFILGGYETTMALHMFAAYNLALYPEIQQKVFEELDQALSKVDDGEFTFDSLNELEYLDMFINETLRIYPPGIHLERTCTKDYKIPNSEMVIKKGNVVYIPVFAIHRDAEYFPDPEKFDPDRFIRKNRSKISQSAFMPFGNGPRSCIGMRLALAEVKVAIAHLVHNFILEPSKKTPTPMQFSNTSGIGVLKPDDGIWLKVSCRK